MNRDPAQEDVRSLPEVEDSEGVDEGDSKNISVFPFLSVPALAGCLVALVLLFGGALFVGRAIGGRSATLPPPAICQVGTPGCELAQPIHEHADFALVIQGEQFDFRQKQFLSYDGNERDPDVHVHDPRHTVVHVHRENVTWDRFLRSLGFKLRDPTLPGWETTELTLPDGRRLTEGEGNTFKFWVNDVRVIGIADLDIRSLQRVLISFGDEGESEAHAQFSLVTDQACIPAGLCPERGSGAGEHGEPCSGQGACVGAR